MQRYCRRRSRRGVVSGGWIGRPLVCWCLVCLLLDAGGRRGGRDGVLGPVGRALEGDDFGVVDDAVDHGGGDGLVFGDLAPAGGGRVGGRSWTPPGS